MKIAIEGCAHGELENIYKTIANIERRDNIKVDLLICCGDFQSTRNLADLQTMAVPDKYKDMGSFYKYYSGELVAPFLTIFIGGNHEASNYLQELPYGGWVAPNIYYLGNAGVIRANGIRIGGISGIYKGHDFLRGRYEFAPYSQSSIRSVYHVRQIDVFRLKQLTGDVDVFISHDWPLGIYNYGNKEQLIRFKPHFRDEIFSNQLGSRPCEDLLQTLKPRRWFAAHLHCQFSAKVPHYSNDVDDNNDEPTHFTEFLALDKCLPRRRFLQIIDIETNDCEEQVLLEYDVEWLSILHHTNHLLSVKNATYYMPGPRGGSDERYNFQPTEDELCKVRSKFNGDLRIPNNFCYTVPAFDPKQGQKFAYTPQPKAQINPQTTLFCDTLGIDDPVSLAMVIGGHELNHSTVLDTSASSSFNESGTSFNSELNSSLHLWNISNCTESPSPPKINASLKLPTPVKTQGSDFTLPLTPMKLKAGLNTDEIDIDNIGDVDSGDESKKRISEVEKVEHSPVNVLKRRTLSTDETVETSEVEKNEQADAAGTTSTLSISSTSLQSNGKSQPKVFKRRNLNIYVHDSDE